MFQAHERCTARQRLDVRIPRAVSLAWWRRAYVVPSSVLEGCEQAEGDMVGEPAIRMRLRLRWLHLHPSRS